MSDSQTSSKFATHLDLLSDSDRRTLLFTLRDMDSQENGLNDLDERTRARDDPECQVKMHHIHLPKLDDYDIINWDREGNTVQRGPAFGEIEPLLELFESHQDKLQLEVEYL